jgi:hypothetical protein
MISQEPFGWVWEVRFNEIQKQKASTTGNTKYYIAANTQPGENQSNDITLKDALEHLQEEHLLVNKISDAILDNELASTSKVDYSTDQLARAIKQKYYPPANDNQINSVLSNLADRIDRVATITNHHSPDVQVTMWQSRNRYNYLHGIADDDEASWHRYRPRI